MVDVSHNQIGGVAVNLRQLGGHAPASGPHDSQDVGPADPVIHDEARHGRQRVLERAYPIAKQLAELLELEVAELAPDAKRLRQAIAVAMLADELEVSQR
jgi:hypothetical protein